MGYAVAVVSAVAGAMAVYAALRPKLAVARERAANLESRVTELASAQARMTADLAAKDTALLAASSELSASKASLVAEREAANDKLELVRQAQQSLSESFDLHAARALKENSAEFLNLAKNLLEQQQKMASGDLDAKKDAIQSLLESAADSLSQLQDRISASDSERKTSESVFGEQIHSLVELQHRLSDETRRLSRALERPTVRGNWGEVQLRRVVEFAGMVEYCDFESQKTFFDDDGRRLRPDLIVKMPNGRIIAVDAKVSLDAFTKAANADQDAEVRQHLEEHARQVRAHIESLSSKAYWEQLPNSPDFVVAFMPSEALLSAALQADRSLLDDAAQGKILLASPLTLIALLKAVYCGWREDKLAKNAEQISSLGRQLYARLVTLGNHLSKLGNHLDRAVSAYNDVIGSIERSAFPAARRFEQLGAASADAIPELVGVDHLARPLQAAEWRMDTSENALDLNTFELPESSGMPS